MCALGESSPTTTMLGGSKARRAPASILVEKKYVLILAESRTSALDEGLRENDLAAGGVWFGTEWYGAAEEGHRGRVGGACHAMPYLLWMPCRGCCTVGDDLWWGAVRCSAVWCLVQCGMLR